MASECVPPPAISPCALTSRALTAPSSKGKAAGVDVELRRQLWAYVLELNRKGVTIVLTTHYLEEAQELCDQIAIINRGQVVACEPTTTLLARMDTRKVLVTPEEAQTAAPALAGFETHLLPSGGF